MPAQRPRAAFEPIPPDFDINKLVEQTPNFYYVDRVSCDQIDEQGLDAFEQLVLLHVIIGGRPLVIDGFENRLDPWTFTPKWLRDNVGAKPENSRNLTTKENLPLTIAHYLNHMDKLANQFFDKPDASDKSRQRIYLKDIDCPQVWHDKLQEQIPASVFYLNESTGEPGGPGATVDPHNNIPGRRLGRGIARAGDLMSSLPADMRAENLMCYIGHEGTYTPAHREMCATMGHNIMVEASKEVGEDGKPERPGSSVWFMTESKDRNTVSEYWLSVLGHDIEVESHFAQVSAWKKAPFSVYVVEQQPGDFILIPPLAPHQVWNRGTRTMKVAWNRTTVETLEMALNEALPKARIVCRDEQYKNKAIVHYTLIKYSNLLTTATRQAEKLPPDAAHALMSSRKIKQLAKDFKRLLNLYKDILLSELFEGSQEKCEYVPFDSNVTCAYCRGNIFNRFLTCNACKDSLGHEDEEPYDVCMDCYAMGRSCGCLSNMKWVEQFKWKELVRNYETWRKQAIDLDGGRVTSRTLLSLPEERLKYTKKTLADVCKEQLKRRPFVELNKAKEKDNSEDSEEDIVVDDEGRVRKTVKKRSKKWLNSHSPCHVCCHRHPNWKSAKCTTCDRWWCFGALFRGADMMPLSIMEDPNWSCPHCKGVCFAGNCRKDPKQTPYEPKGTLLGHDTRKVADARSVECLVDFSMSNLNWIRDDDDNAHESARIRRAREEAQQAKAVDPRFDGHYVEGEEDHEEDVEATHVRFEYSPDEAPLDPQLAAPDGTSRNANVHPALRTESDLLDSLSRANQSLPPPSAMLQGARPTNAPVPAGYVPATTSGFVAPTAPMYDQEEVEDNEDGYTYPDPNPASSDEDAEHEREEPRTTTPRPFGRPHKGYNKEKQGDVDDAIFMDARPKKKRRTAQDASNERPANKPRNEATKQFEKERARKALDEAKRQGRFIAVQAALRGKSRVVKLRVPGAKLAQLLAQQTARQPQPVPEPADEEVVEATESALVLQSDLAPPKEKVPKEAANASRPKVRVERDDDFNMRRDRRRPPEGKRKRRATTQYEEIEELSDNDLDGLEEELADNAARMAASKGEDGRRRISAYIRRKHQDEPDLPDELPENYKDGAGRRRTTGNAAAPTRSVPASRARPNGSKTKKSKSGGRPSAASVAGLDGANDLGNQANGGAQVNAEPDEPHPATETDPFGAYSFVDDAHAATLAMQEENRRAKLEALGLLDDEPDTSHVKTPLKSIFDRKGKHGKPRIVSVANAGRVLPSEKARAIAKGLAGEEDSDSGSDGVEVMAARAVGTKKRLG